MRTTLRALLTAAFAVAFAAPAFAQSKAAWPDRPIRIIVPFAPGAFTDASARLLARELSEQIGQQVIVENKTGAGGTIGADTVAKSAPDGTTLLYTETSFAMTPALQPNLPYDAMNDLVPVSQVADATAVLMARAGLPAATLGELVTLARAKPKSLSFASAGTGSSSHLPIEHFMALSGIQMLHVPFKGAGASIPEVIAGRVDMVMSSVATGGPHIKSGKLRAVAVTGTDRSPVLPNVPTFAEAGYPQYRMSYWFGLFAPRGTPADVVQRLEKEVARAMTSQRLREAFAQQGARPVGNRSDEFKAFVNEQITLWRNVVKTANIKPD